MAKTKSPSKKSKNYDLKAILKREKSLEVKLNTNPIGALLPVTENNLSFEKDGLLFVLDCPPKPSNNKGRWVKVQDVKTGDWIVQQNGKISQVQEIDRQIIPQPIDVHNLEVSGNHNYFANGILVHNAGPEYKPEDIKVLHGSVNYVDSMAVAVPENRDLLSESLTDLIQIVGKTPNLTFMQQLQFKDRLGSLQSNITVKGWNAKLQTEFEAIKKDLDTTLQIRAIETNNYSLYTSTEQRIETAHYVKDILRDELIEASPKEQEKILKELNYWENVEGNLRQSLVNNTNQQQTEQAFLITDLLMLIASPEEKVTQTIIEKPLEKLIGKYSPTILKLVKSNPVSKLILRSIREQALKLKKYNAIIKGPLSDIIAGEMKIAGKIRQVTVAETFRGGSYIEYVTQEPTKLYRVFSDPERALGEYWTRTKPSGPLQATIDSALAPEWGNKAQKWIEIEVPKGTKLYEGTAATVESRIGNHIIGGGNQVFIDRKLIQESWKKSQGAF